MSLYPLIAECARKLLDAALPLNSDQRTAVSFMAQLPWYLEQNTLAHWQQQMDSLLEHLPASMDTDLIVSLYQWARLLLEGKRSTESLARHYRNLRLQALGCGVNLPMLPEH